jgi:soluble lytic murein transglycosylase
VNVKRTEFFLVAFGLMFAGTGTRAQQPVSAPVVLSPTNHPRVPTELTQLWLVPESATKGRTGQPQDLVSAIKLEAEGSFTKALPILSRATVAQGPLGRYAVYYKGLAEAGLGRQADARRTFQGLQSADVVGYLSEAAALREAESSEALGDYSAAATVYERLAGSRAVSDDILMRLGRAAKMAGSREKATAAFARLYFEFPLSDFALSAGAELDSGPIVSGSARYKSQLERAERLFAAKRYELARTEFDALRKVSQADDNELIDLRIAECDYFLKRPRNARDRLRPYLEQATRQAEALYYYANALRDLGNDDEYRRIIGRIPADFPSQTWAEEALNSLATYEIVHDNDAQADEVFRELYSRFPTGRYAERAAWKIGWYAYRNGRFAETTRTFAKAAFDFPRSDYRPAWLYWSGRAHEALGELTGAQARYALEVTDYINTYYGRLAAARQEALGVQPAARRIAIADVRTPEASASPDGSPQAARVVLPRNASVIRALLDLELYDHAVDELRYAQRTWGDSSVIQATLAWVYTRQGRSAKGTEQFNLLRGAIMAMKRAYPQHLALAGEELPDDVLRIIFPLSYWDLIRKYATEYEIDPYVAAALICQESTFVPDIKSYANAVGLTQLMPRTARQYAKTLNLRYSSGMLTNPEANIRIGMAYLAAKLKEFGELHFALASYNAGERPVRRWIAERPGIEREEFIDDIPYPQTQNYVKKILATAEDYRRLYGPGSAGEAAVAQADAAPPALQTPLRPKVTSGRPAPRKASSVSRSPGKKKKTRKAA